MRAERLIDMQDSSRSLIAQPPELASSLSLRANHKLRDELARIHDDDTGILQFAPLLENPLIVG